MLLTIWPCISCRGARPTLPALSFLSSPPRPERQVYVLSGRLFRSWVRNPAMLLAEAMQYMFEAVFIGERMQGFALFLVKQKA